MNEIEHRITSVAVSSVNNNDYNGVHTDNVDKQSIADE